MICIYKDKINKRLYVEAYFAKSPIYACDNTKNTTSDSTFIFYECKNLNLNALEKLQT